MAVHHRVLQLGPPAFDTRRHRASRQLRQQAHKAIVGGQTHQVVEARVGHAAAFGQQIRGGGQRAADDDGVGGLVQAGDLGHWRAAESERREVVGNQMAVERVADVRQEHGSQAEQLDEVAQMLQIARRQRRVDQQIDLLRSATDAAAVVWHEDVDDALHRQRETAFETADVVGRVHRDDGNVVVLRVTDTEFPHVAADIGALGLGKPGRRQADHRRPLLAAQGLETLDDIVVGAEHGAGLIHCRGLQRDRFAKMTHEEDLGEGGAALRSVQHRNGVVDAEEGQRGAGGRAGLQGIDRQRLGPLSNFRHYATSASMIVSAGASSSGRIRSSSSRA